jgi:hypothetical protein
VDYAVLEGEGIGAMTLLACVVLLTGLYPLGRAWVANRDTSLEHAVLWALAAWAAWLGALLAAPTWPAPEAQTLRYLALSLTGCGAVAVLGARRPGVWAWNFVVVGLLAVLLLPVAEGLGRPRLHWPNTIFLASTLAVGFLNYLPTRLAPAVLVFALGCGDEFLNLFPAENGDGVAQQALPFGELLLAVSPWVALAQFGRGALPPSQFDRLWLDFRDRFGFVWGQRLREQFNRAAANAGWPVYLRWRGLRLKAGADLPPEEVQNKIVEALRALLKRFGPGEQEGL